MRNILMKKGIYSGIKWISCNLLILAVFLALTGCRSAVGSDSGEPVRETDQGASIESIADKTTETSNESVITDEKKTQLDETLEETELDPIKSVDISYEYQKMSTHASNQMAVWVEDESGDVIRTIMVTNFVAGRRGYREREDALSSWVAAVDPDGMSDDEIDAITSATPSAGQLSYSWDLTDNDGNRVPDGTYFIKMEGTQFWESNVLYIAEVNTETTPDGELEYQEIRSAPDNHENETMITEMKMIVVR